MNERHILTQALEESLTRRANQVAISTEVAQRIAAAPALDTLFYRVVHLVQEKFGYYHAHVYVVEGDDSLVLQEGTGDIGQQMKQKAHTIPLSASRSIVAQAARLGDAVLVPDVSQNPYWLPNALLPDTQAEVAVPIKLGDEVLGVLDVQNDTVGSLDQEDELLLLGLCGQIAVAINNRRLENEREQAKAALQAYADELGQSYRELQRFAQVASHDLQEPLRKIQTFSDRLQYAYKDVLDEKGQDYLNRTRRSAAQMQALLNGVIEFTKVITGGQTFSPIDLNQVLAYVLADLKAEIQASNATISVSPLETVEADASQMHQLFYALISNALKFHKLTVPPIITIQSTVIATNGEAYCQITIADNGIGLDEKYSDNIFDAFKRLHSGKTYGGTGIGLAICRKVMERHKGSITVKSQLGEGSTFLITLPLLQIVSAQQPYNEDHY